MQVKYGTDGTVAYTGTDREGHHVEVVMVPVGQEWSCGRVVLAGGCLVTRADIRVGDRKVAIGVCNAWTHDIH